MKGLPEERAITLGNYIIEHDATVRQAAKEFNISKSTVHKDVSERLKAISPQPVSYTHLDVYKRQMRMALPSWYSCKNCWGL